MSARLPIGLGPRLIDTGDPVADDPLNLGLTAWWMGLRHNSGSVTHFDILLPHRNNGTFNGGASQIGGVNGFGAVQLVGASSQFVSVPNNATNGAASVGGFTLEVDALIVSNTTFDTIAAVGYVADTVPWLMDLNGSNGVRFGSYNPGVIVSAALPVAGVRTHILGTADGTNVTLYMNGVQAVQSASTTLPGSHSQPIGIGYLPAIGRYISATVYSVRMSLKRAASAADAARLYEESLEGYPRLLRRFSSTVWTFGTAGGGTPTTLSPSSLLGAGTQVAPVVATGTTLTPSPVAARGVLTPSTVATGTMLPLDVVSGVGTQIAPAVETGTELVPDSLVGHGTLTTSSLSGAVVVQPHALSGVGTVVAPSLTVGTSLVLTALVGRGVFAPLSILTGTSLTVGGLGGIGILVSPSFTVGTSLTVEGLSGRGTLIAPSAATGTVLLPETLTGEGVLIPPVVGAVYEVQLSPLAGEGRVTTIAVLVGTGVSLTVLSARGTLVAITVSGGVVTVPPIDSVTLNFDYLQTVPLNFDFVQTVTLNFDFSETIPLDF